MSTAITRRAMLAGASSIAANSVLTASVAPTHPDTELLQSSDQHVRRTLRGNPNR